MKKRRCSTSDKPNDVTIGEAHKKSKLLDTCDIYTRPNVNNVMKIDNPVFLPENNSEKKTDGKGIHVEQPQITANGKNCTLSQVSSLKPCCICVCTLCRNFLSRQRNTPLMLAIVVKGLPDSLQRNGTLCACRKAVFMHPIIPFLFRLRDFLFWEILRFKKISIEE